ncbi:MAG: orotate phosphoribosyltransferase [Pseudomonadota bacterium]
MIDLAADTEDAAATLKEFEAAGALLRGHFILSSGRRSAVYLNKSVVSTDPARTERLCRRLAKAARAAFGQRIDAVVSPAMGGIIFGYETARHLETPFMYAERAAEGFALRRGFSVRGKRILIVEDIVSTGLSARECVEAVKRAGGEVLAVGCLIDRSGGTADAGARLLPLARLDVASYAPDALPSELAAIPAVKPGSRGNPS